MRLAFFGTPAFALPPLQVLQEKGYEVAGVYTQPPRPKGRGHPLQKSPIHLFAEGNNIPLFTPTTLKDPQEQLKFAELGVDLAVVVAYGLMLPLQFLNTPKWGCINIHASLLPRWRGAAPIQRAMLAGDRQTGVTIMLMDPGMDTGPILTQQACMVPPATTLIGLHDHLALMGAALLEPTIRGYLNGQYKPQPQPRVGVTMAPKISPIEGELQWHKLAADLERAVRAFNPWPGTWFRYHGERIKVLQAAVVRDINAAPGIVIDNALTVACGSGALRLTVLQRPGGKPLAAGDFLNGYPVPSGTNLTFPQ